MTRDNQEDSFDFLQEDEVSKSKQEVLNTIRFGNNSLDKQLTFLLKNFISVSLMNRYYFKGETHTAKASLSCLNSPQYQSLALLLQVDKNAQYQDLLGLVSDSDAKKEYFISAKYKKNLYRFYQKPDSKKIQLSNDKFSLAMQRIVYMP